MLSIINIIQLLIITQGLLFSGALIQLKSDRRFSNRLLASFLLLLALQMTLHLLMDKSVLSPSLWGLRGVVFAYGPLLYLYVQSLIRRRERISSLDFLHFVPALLIILGSFILSGIGERVGWLLYLSLIVYLTGCYRLLYTWKKEPSDLSHPRDIKLNWLKLALGIFSLIMFSDLISFGINTWFPDSLADNWSDYIVLGLVMVFVNIMVFKSLLQPGILAAVSEEKLRTVDSRQINRTQIYQLHQHTIRQLEAMMQNEQPYLQAHLTLQDLAQSLAIPPRQLSEIVNQYYGQNFAEFVNAYRLAAAEKRFQQPSDQKETVLEVMYEVGFNSKSSFNTLFKKRTGLTPTAYKQKYTPK